MIKHCPLYLLPNQVNDALAAGVIRMEDKGVTWDERRPIPAQRRGPPGELQLGPGGINVWHEEDDEWVRGWGPKP